jgi:hypothetical protein
MASSERKRKHRKMQAMGWVWNATYNEWVKRWRHPPPRGVGWERIRHLPSANAWVVDGPDHQQCPSFACYLVAAVWAEVESGHKDERT